MRKNSFGQSVLVVLVLFLIGTLGKTSEPKCIKAGCDNKRASGSDYCYIHKPSSSYHSTPSDSTSSDSKDSYSKPSDSGVTDSNTEKTEQTTEYTNSGNSGSSTTKHYYYDSYDDGYDDIYMDGDYDSDRYDTDDDYAEGVDDAMDEFDEDW